MSIPIQECPECGFVTPCKCEKRKNPTYGQLLAGGKLDEPTTPAPTPWSAKSEAYWYEQYQLMRERYHRQIGENSKQAERIVQLEEALRNIANGDMRTSRAKAKMALEGTFPPVDENPEQAERIDKQEEQLNVMRFLFNQAAKELESEQAAKRELEEHSTKQDFLIDELADSLRAMVAHCEGFISNLKEGK